MWWQYTLYLLLEAAAVLAQTAVPTNATLPKGLANPGELLFSLSGGSTGYGNNYDIDVAVHASKGTGSPQENIDTNQTIILTTPSTVTSLTNNSIAYITCDPANYTGNISLQQLIYMATAKIAPSYQFGAIILYTTTASWCNYTIVDPTYTYALIYVLPGAAKALAVEQALLAVPPGQQVASIFSNTTTGGQDTSGSNDNGGQNGGIMGPSTTVAMIILYSVTGVITLCFVIVIITGALRARRHPERYGLLNLPGNAHQRRARGIARAMLDTIPIVKFGGQEPIKIPRDVEQGAEMRELPEAKTQSVDSTHSPVTEAHPSIIIGEAITSGEASPTHAEHAAVDDNNADNGLACSVCTEDFVKGQDLRVLPCDHKFHPECIDPWLLNVSGTCPLCRIDLRPPEEQEEERQLQEAAAAAASAAAATNAAGGDPVPGRLPRFSTYLNYRRMRDATPAQRLRVLRDLRNLRRGHDNAPPVPTTQSGDASPSTSTAEATPTHSNRVSRFFRRRDDSPPTEGPGSS